MTRIDEILRIAREQLGTIEATGNNDGAPSVLYAGGRREPWCADFVAYVFRQAGCPLPGDVVPSLKQGNPIALVTRLELELTRAGWETPGPSRGGIVCFRFGGDVGHTEQHHVGIIEDAGSAAVSTIEGNSANGVHRRVYSRIRLASCVSSYAAVPLALLEPEPVAA
jgi:CHAP domain